MKAVSKEDAESNARLVKALFSEGLAEEDADDVNQAIFNAVEEQIEKDKETPSHMQLDYDEDGNPTQLRFVCVPMWKQGPPDRPARSWRLIGRGWLELEAA